MKNIILIFVFAGLSFSLIGQESFQISESDDSGQSLLSFQINDDSTLFLFYYKGFSDTTFSFLELNPSQSFKAKGQKFSIKKNQRHVFTQIDEIFNSQIISSGAFRVLLYDDIIFGWNKTTNETWVKWIDKSEQDFRSINFHKNRICVLSWGRNNDFSIIQIAPATGETIEKWGYQINPLLISPSSEITEMAINTQDSTFFISGHHEGEQGQGQIILKINSSGRVENGIILNGFRLYDKIFFKKKLYISPIGDLYLMGRSERDPLTNQNNLNVLKFDKNLDLKFSKTFSGEKLSLSEYSITFRQTGDPILAYVDPGAFPLIYTNLDSSGNILKETGYALYSPKINFSPDGSLVMTTNRHFNETGRTFKKNIIAKTDRLGMVDGCDTYDARLKSLNFDVQIDTFVVNSSFPIPSLNKGTVMLKPFEIQFEPFCDLPPAPNPDFATPDTLCLHDCLATDSTLGNRNAQAAEWILEGENIQAVISDSTEFEYCFDSSGTYTLRQTIWFLGVDYSFEKIIEVLPPLEINIESDSLICETPPAQIKLQSNRPSKNIEWSTGETTPIAHANQSGNYSVTADDGFCHASDSAFLEFIFEKIDTNLAIQMPDSIIVCEANLPFELRPKSRYSDVFKNEQSELDSVFLLSKTGDYFFSTNILGCNFSKKIYLETDPCKAEIFTPSAFSPNNDGINDDFLPLGKNIEPVRLHIFDRWGEKLFESNDSQLSWDGKFNEKSAAKGVYVFRFEYVNLLNGVREEIAGDVAVLK